MCCGTTASAFASAQRLGDGLRLVPQGAVMFVLSLGVSRCSWNGGWDRGSAPRERPSGADEGGSGGGQARHLSEHVRRVVDSDVSVSLDVKTPGRVGAGRAVFGRYPPYIGSALVYWEKRPHASAT